MTSTIRIIAGIFLLLLPVTTFAQIPDTTSTSLSPNAASLGQYGDIPVSMFTGTPNISIPLYQFSVEGKSFPITLSYHTSGIRVEQSPSWVGAGWSLHASGCITRKVNGAADETYGENPNIPNTSKGYFYNLDKLASNKWDTDSFISDYLSNTHNWILEDKNDMEPDEFVISAPGISGSFMKAHDGTWAIKSDVPLRIDSMLIGNMPFPTPITHTKVILGFVISDGNGARYHFGFNPNSIEFSIPFNSQYHSFWVSNCWNLTRIEFANGLEVLYDYVRGDFTAHTWMDHSLRTARYGDYVKVLHWPSNEKNGVLISPVYLHEISFPGGRISLNSSNRQQMEHASTENLSPDNEKYYYLVKGTAGHVYTDRTGKKCMWPITGRSLNSLIVTSVDNQNEEITKQILKFDFNYHNYSSNTTHRLALKEITQEMSDSTSSKYTFTYNSISHLPLYNSNMIDHWGYYNGKRWNRSTSDRTVGPDSVIGRGVLTKITYPTGGYTRFEYEKNYCSKVVNDSTQTIENISMPVGGVRIKKIINNHTNLHSGENVWREYIYKDDINGTPSSTSGVLAGIPKYSVCNYSLPSCKSPNDISDNGIFTFDWMEHSVFSGGDNGLGSPIGYSTVFEKYPNGSYRKYTFSNYDNGYGDSPACAVFTGTRTSHVMKSFRGQERGLPLCVEDFNSSSQLLSKRTYKYICDTTQFVRAMHVNYIDSYLGNLYAEAATYKNFTFMPKLVADTSIIYSDGISQKTVTTRSYNSIGQLFRVATSIGNDSIVENTTYLWQEYPIAYNQDFAISQISEVRKQRISENSQVLADLGTTRYEHSRYLDRTWLPDKKILISSYNGQQTCDTIQYQYDNCGKLVSIKDGTSNTLLLWGNNHQNIAAIIKNATRMQLLSKSSFDIIEWGNQDDCLLTDMIRTWLPNSLVSSYLYSPLIGVIETTSPSFLRTTYRYDQNGRLNGILDHGNNYVKSFRYHYKTETHESQF